MAAPRNGFRAHHSNVFPLRDVNEGIQTLFEFGALHIVGKAPERCILPCSIDRIRPRSSQSAESGQVNVSDIERLERRGQYLAIELGIMP